MVTSCTGESNTLTSSFPLCKEEDVELDETKEDGDLKPKP